MISIGKATRPADRVWRRLEAEVHHRLLEKTPQLLHHPQLAFSACLKTKSRLEVSVISYGSQKRRNLPFHLAYHWDYSDWNSTLGHHAGGGPAAAGPYGTLSHLSVATDDDYGTGTLPRGVCRLEETDSEYAANESGNDDHDTEDKTESERKSRLRGDEFTKELMALTRAFGRQKGGTSDSDDTSSSRPILSTFKANGTNGNGHSYLDRYLPRPVDPPSSTASERKLLLSSNGGGDTTESSSAVPDQFSDDDDEEFTTPSAVFQSSLLDASRISEIGGGASSDGERSTDSVVPASVAAAPGVRREDSTLIVCSISDDEDDAAKDPTEVEKSKTGTNNNRTFSKKSKKQTQV